MLCMYACVYYCVLNSKLYFSFVDQGFSNELGVKIKKREIIRYIKNSIPLFHKNMRPIIKIIHAPHYYVREKSTIPAVLNNSP